jgi:RNA polymerase sigma-70 factor, ECF subfamily
VQETFLRAFRSFHRFNPGTNCRAWLFTIMRNIFLNRVRRADREVLDADMTLLDAAPESATAARSTRDNPEEEFLQTVVHGDVDRALRALPLVFREAIVLADIEGLTYKEVAEVLGCPIGTVMSRLAPGFVLRNHRPLRAKRLDWHDEMLVRLEGIEPPTLGLEVRRSIQLSYRRVLGFSLVTRRGSTPREPTCPKTCPRAASRSVADSACSARRRATSWRSAGLTMW